MPANNPQVLLSGFADEAAPNKTLVEQFVAFAALGLKYYSIRFMDVGSGVKNVMDLSDDEIRTVVQQQSEYGLSVASIGSPIGKVKLLDVDDGTQNRFVPFEEYLAGDVQRACRLAHSFDTKLVRGFSFYHPRGENPGAYLPQAVDRIGQITDVCKSLGVIYGLEVEANLVGQNGPILAEIHRQISSPSLMLIFDAANLLCQGLSAEETFQHYEAMKAGTGWFHIKDYGSSVPLTESGYVDHDALTDFISVDPGSGVHQMFLGDFRDSINALTDKLKSQGVPGLFLDLEPHLKGGGQFGGFSGPDGMGVALRALCRVLDQLDIDYSLRDLNDVRASAGK